MESGGYAVSEHVAANMSVNIAAGQAWVPGTSAAGQGQYFVRNGATVNLAIAAASATNPRIDKIVLRIKDKAYAGTEDEAILEVVTGTAEAGATLANRKGAGATPANSLVLAYVLVPALATSIVGANIENAAAAATGSTITVVPSAKSIIATEESRTNAAFGTLPTPDEVTVTLPTNGLIAIAYQATWRESVLNTAVATVFLGATEIQAATANSPTGKPVAGAEGVGATTQESEVNAFLPLYSTHGGLEAAKIKAGFGYLGDVTTGQLLGRHGVGGPMYVFAAAGTYKITVQFKSSSGTVTAKGRKLWAWVVA